MVDEESSHEEARHPSYRLYRRREVWLSIILGSLILLCGIAIGSSVVILRFKDRIWPGPRVIHTRRSPEIIATRMQRRLELTDEQTEKVEALLHKHFEGIQAVHKDARKKIEAEHKQLRAGMKKVLTAEQFERWDSRFKRMKARSWRDKGPERSRGRRKHFDRDLPPPDPFDSEHGSPPKR